MKREQLNWFATLRQTKRDGTLIRKAVPSEDGRLIAIPGWYSGLAVVSVPEKRLLWETPGRDIGGIADASFSPDGKTVYCGGSDGCVYQMDSATGIALHEWWANNEDRSKYGQRITSIAVSGDGRLVAAGTGPEGLVYVATAAGEKVRVFSHGITVYTLSFSPDSKSLATVAGGKIKI